MKKSLYLKFILGYIFFALLSFFTIATISARLTYHHCLEQQAGILRADAVRMADECSSLYTGGSETPETLYPGADTDFLFSGRTPVDYRYERNDRLRFRG